MKIKKIARKILMKKALIYEVSILYIYIYIYIVSLKLILYNNVQTIFGKFSEKLL